MAIQYIDKAFGWAIKPDKLHPNRTNWENLLIKVEEEYQNPSRLTIMRNQAQVGFCNSYWPVLSRLLIMGHPKYAEKIHPITVSDLDDEHGRARLASVYQSITGREPKVDYWRDAL